jgi:hypothetical protein
MVKKSLLIVALLVLVLWSFSASHYDVRAKEDHDWMTEGKWLLVHGMGGAASDWNGVKNVLQSYGVLSGDIYVPDLRNDLMLHQWTCNLVNWMDSQGMLSLPDGSVKVVAHSFGGAVTLYLLRATYELQFGNISVLASDIWDPQTETGACGAFWSGANRIACEEIADGLRELNRNPGIAQRWIEAAKKIQGVYLYHPAIRGGCLACIGGWTYTWTAASACALGTVDVHLWFPVSHLTWENCKKIVNIYGFGGGGIGCHGPYCGWGAEAHDGVLQDDHQRLIPGDDGDESTQTEGSYTELFGGYHCHSDFKDNSNNATQDLVTKIVENPTPYPYGIPLCGSVYDGNGGPLTDRCPYLVSCSVIVPEGETLTIDPSAMIYFKSGLKIIANGTLNANGNLDKPIKLFSENAPHHGMKLMTGLRLQNGGEFKPGQ